MEMPKRDHVVFGPSENQDILPDIGGDVPGGELPASTKDLK